jgi:hypothetical protein
MLVMLVRRPPQNQRGTSHNKEQAKHSRSFLEQAQAHHTYIHTMSESTWVIEGGSEVRLEVPDGSTCTIKLTKGTAEIFGVEMVEMKEYTITNMQVCSINAPLSCSPRSPHHPQWSLPL